MTNTPNPFAAFEAQPHPLRDYFKRRHITQTTLANYCGIVPKYMNAMLNGYVPTPAHIEAKLQEARELAETM
ncbi:MAG: helix-turn-helix transcriptional regulator [Thermodesulfobacteriota bacterium]